MTAELAIAKSLNEAIEQHVAFLDNWTGRVLKPSTAADDMWDRLYYVPRRALELLEESRKSG